MVFYHLLLSEKDDKLKGFLPYSDLVAFHQGRRPPCSNFTTNQLHRKKKLLVRPAVMVILPRNLVVPPLGLGNFSAR